MDGAHLLVLAMWATYILQHAVCGDTALSSGSVWAPGPCTVLINEYVCVARSPSLWGFQHAQDGVVLSGGFCCKKGLLLINE